MGLADGTPVGEPLRGHDGRVNAVAVGTLADGSVIVSGGERRDGAGLGRPTAARVGEPLRGHDGWVRAVALGTLADEQVIVSGGDDGTVRVWRWPTATRVASRCAATTARCTRWRSGR